jgi:hypothetical protein
MERLAITTDMTDADRGSCLPTSLKRANQH